MLQPQTEDIKLIGDQSIFNAEERDILSGKAWYTLHTKPHKENQLYSFLQSRGIETFYPRIHVKPVNPRASRIRPYFPRYLFAHIDLDDADAAAIRWAPGLHRLVEFGGCPAEVPDAVIDQLKRRINEIELAGWCVVVWSWLSHKISGQPLDCLQVARRCVGDNRFDDLMPRFEITDGHDDVEVASFGLTWWAPGST